MVSYDTVLRLRSKRKRGGRGGEGRGGEGRGGVKMRDKEDGVYTLIATGDRSTGPSC